MYDDMCHYVRLRRCAFPGLAIATGIAQGCPLSVPLIAALLHPWAHMVKTAGTTPRLLADDVLLMASGKDHTARFFNPLFQ